MYCPLQILARRQKNNPVLIGEPGVGKTARIPVSKHVGERGARLLAKLNLSDLQPFSLSCTQMIGADP